MARAYYQSGYDFYQNPAKTTIDSMIKRPNILATVTSEFASGIAATAASSAIRLSGPQANSGDFAITLGVIDRTNKSSSLGSFNGDLPMYPASVVKLFYGAYAVHQISSGHLNFTPEIERAMHDMLSASSNDACALVLDMLCGTTGGPELPEEELEAWMNCRWRVTKWFRERGYSDLIACQKPWNEGPYGRERQGYGAQNQFRNSCTSANACRLMVEIALGTFGSPERILWLQSFLERDLGVRPRSNDYQTTCFSGSKLPKDVKLFSKAGWTDEVRHDVAWVVTPEGREYVWAIFSQNHSSDEELLKLIGLFLFTELEKSELS